jgi:2-(1,2-epoxy-1,2-dihydrophenyl)acetyl-CoA isomerase
MVSLYHRALDLFRRLDAPLVCAVRGGVAGGGLGLAYCADIVLAADDARFTLGFGGLGLSGDGGSSWFLPRLVGPRRAAELYFEQRVLTASEAVEWGIASRVVPAASLHSEAIAVARRLADGPTRAYAEIRGLLRGSADASLTDQLAAEQAALMRTAGTPDAAEGITAFGAKRTPRFRGR